MTKKKITKEKAISIINSIKQRYPQLRQDSKGITFASQYQGTYKTHMENAGLSYDDAIKVEKNYHKLYQISDEWTEQALKQGSDKGYVNLAFGGRLRTPILAQTILGKANTPYEARNEYRSAGNALIQSYCILNTRAAIEFMDRVYKSKYKYQIHPCALIHDAFYLKWKNDPEITHWINTNLIECMGWNDLPELTHPIVKLGAELDLFMDWSYPLTLPNNAPLQEIIDIQKKGVDTYIQKNLGKV